MQGPQANTLIEQQLRQADLPRTDRHSHAAPTGVGPPVGLPPGLTDHRSRQVQAIALQVIAVLEGITEPQHLVSGMVQKTGPAARPQIQHGIDAVVQQDQALQPRRQTLLLQPQPAVLEGTEVAALIAPPQPTDALLDAPAEGIGIQLVGKQQHLPTALTQVSQLAANAALQPAARVVVRKQHQPRTARLHARRQLHLLHPHQGIDRRQLLAFLPGPQGRQGLLPTRLALLQPPPQLLLQPAPHPH